MKLIYAILELETERVIIETYDAFEASYLFKSMDYENKNVCLAIKKAKKE